MKTMKAMKAVLIPMLMMIFAAPLAAYAETPSDLVVQAKSVLQMMDGNGSVQFASAESRAMFQSALANLDRAQSMLRQGDQSDHAELDAAVDEARFIQKALASYLAEKEFFGYRLKRGPVSFEVVAGVGYERAIRNMPWIGRVGGGGVVRINPGEQYVTQFNSLKAEFYGALAQAASLNPADSRINALAQWGRDTKVIYPGQSFGEEILGFSEYVNLRLH